MTTYTWIGANGADWSVAGDWTPAGGPPGAADTALVPAAGAVTIGEAQSIEALNIAGAVAIIASGVPFSVLGFVSGAGLLLDQGTLQIAGSAAALSGNGTVEIGGSSDGAAIMATASGNVLDNINDVITGTGTLGGDGLVLTNEADGVINAASLIAGAATLTVNAGAAAMLNAGLMEATSSVLTATGAIQNSGTIASNGGSVLVEGNIQNTGTITAAGGGVFLTNATIVGGTLTTSNNDSIVSNGATLDGSGSPVTNLGWLTVATLTLVGTVDNQGTVRLYRDPNVGISIAPSGATLTGGGAIMADAATQALTIGGGTLVNVDNTISGEFISLTGPVTNEALGLIQGQYDYYAQRIQPIAVADVTNLGLISHASIGDADQTGGGTIQDSSIGLVLGGTIGGSSSATTLDGSSMPILNIGAIGQTSGSTTLLGSIDNTGDLRTENETIPGDRFHPPQPLPSSWFIVGSPVVTLTGGGAVSLGASQPGAAGAIIAAATGDVLVNVDNTIDGVQPLGAGGLVLTNEAAA